MKLKLMFLLLLLALMPLASAYYYAPETAWFHDYGLDFLSDWLNSLGVECPADNVCVSEFYAGYLNEGCEFSYVRHCDQGCELGVCLGEIPEEPECEPGWQCQDDMYLVYQYPNCNIRDKYFCVWGCHYGECNWGTSFRVE